MYDTGIRSNASGSAMTFLAPIDCYIALSYYTMKPHEAYIVNTKNLNGACHALEYPLVFHPFYEDIGAKYNKESECWELNGLTDLSEDDMHEIYQGSIGFSYGLPLDGFFYGRTIIRTTPHLRFSPEGVSMKNTFSRCWNLEIIDFTETSMHTLILNSESTAMYETFYGCTELREIKFILDVNNNEESNLFFDTFKACNSLKTVLIRNISQSISFEDSPLISIDSISELIYYKKDSSSEITVTVHPNTYSYLIGTAEPPAEVGGTAANWQKWMANGVKKGITFAVSE